MVNVGKYTVRPMDPVLVCSLVCLKLQLSTSSTSNHGSIEPRDLIFFNGWDAGSPKFGGIGGIVHPPIGSILTTYIPLIVLAFWQYITVICYLPPFRGTRNNH